MPWIQQPTVTGLPGGKHVVRFSYEFAGDPIVPVNLGATTIQGTAFVINPLALQNSVGLPPFKCIQFLCDTLASAAAADLSDGAIYIYSQSTGQLIAHGFNNEPNPSTPAAVTGWVSGISELVCAKDGPITIAKAAKGGIQLVGGIIATIFDFGLVPFVERYTTS